MGCWNETCLLTRLPIQSDEKTVCVLIAERPNVHSACYADDIFTPVSLPIFGRYNDYGNLEQLEDTCDALELLREIKLYAKTNAGFVPYQIRHDNIKDYTISLIGQADHDELYTEMQDVETRQTAYSRIFPVFMLREFYDFAIRARGDMLADVEYKNLHLYSIGLMDNLPVRHAKTLASHEGQQKLVKDLVLLNTFMGTMRIAWAPTTGSGSQNCLENDYQDDFYDLMRDRAKDIHLQSKWD